MDQRINSEWVAGTQSSDQKYISVEQGLKEAILVAFKNCLPVSSENENELTDRIEEINW